MKSNNSLMRILLVAVLAGAAVTLRSENTPPGAAQTPATADKPFEPGVVQKPAQAPSGAAEKPFEPGVIQKPKPAPTAPGSTQKPQAGKTTQAAPVAPVKKQEELTIPGLVIPRKNGGFLGLVLENSNFKLSFYDKDKKPIAADVARAAAHWKVQYSIYEERVVLNPAPDGMALTSSKFIRPPYLFKLYLTLVTEGDNPSSENFPAIDFHG
jgi:hypothetical protein